QRGGPQRQPHPQDHVQKDARSAAETYQPPQPPHQSRVHIQIVGHTGAYTAEFLVDARSHQPFRPAGCRGHIRRVGYHLPCAAVVAKPRSVRDVPLAAVANHKSLPQAGIFPALSDYTPKQAKKLLPTEVPLSPGFAGVLACALETSGTGGAQYSSNCLTVATTVSDCGRITSSSFGW